jgi:hypothetical protein
MVVNLQLLEYELDMFTILMTVYILHYSTMLREANNKSIEY